MCTPRGTRDRCTAVLYYCTYEQRKLAAQRPRRARARDFVNFRKKYSCIARARQFDSLPSLSDVGTLSFRWIFPFWYFCFLLEDKARLALSSKRKQKYQNGNIHRNLRVPTSTILLQSKVQYWGWPIRVWKNAYRDRLCRCFGPESPRRVSEYYVNNNLKIQYWSNL